VAFETVLADAEGEWDVIWCLGDLIGYGPNPNECVALLREHEHISLSGNHDWAALGKLDIQNFNIEAQAAIQWTRNALTDQTRDYLDALPTKMVREPFTLAHASPRQPVWEYILDPYTAATNFEYFDTPYCLVGHTHVPALFEIQDNNIIARVPLYREPIHLNDARLIINPGSVGQPRDSDPRAAYALLNTDSMDWVHRRISYPVGKTQELMRQQGMPPRLIERLEFGW